MCQVLINLLLRVACLREKCQILDFHKLASQTSSFDLANVHNSPMLVQYFMIESY